MADLAPLLGVAGLILVKEVGVPVPVPGDLVVIGAGVAASRGDLDPAAALVAIVIASIAGGVGQYLLLRSVARPTVLGLLGRLAGPDRLDRQSGRLRAAGARGVAVARMTPGVRIAAIAASAVADVAPGTFVAGLAVGNAIFIAGHFALGYALGEPVLRLAGAALGPLAAAGVGLAAVGLIGWLIIGRRRGAARRDTGATLADWTDACCPACLMLGAVRVASPAR